MIKNTICNFTLAIACAIVGSVFLPTLSEAQDAQSESGFLEARPMIDPVQIERVHAEWQRELRAFGMKGHISHCRLMVEALYADTKDESYGAVCSFDGGNIPRDIMLCEDTLIGNLTIKAWGFVYSERDVLEFTKKNCPAGG